MSSDNNATIVTAPYKPHDPDYQTAMLQAGGIPSAMCVPGTVFGADASHPMGSNEWMERSALRVWTIATEMIAAEPDATFEPIVFLIGEEPGGNGHLALTFFSFLYDSQEEYFGHIDSVLEHGFKPVAAFTAVTAWAKTLPPNDDVDLSKPVSSYEDCVDVLLVNGERPDADGLTLMGEQLSPTTFHGPGLTWGITTGAKSIFRRMDGVDGLIPPTSA